MLKKLLSFLGIKSDSDVKVTEKETKNNEINVKVYAPLSGKVVALENVPDVTFAQKMLGEGLAIEPSTDGEILAPISGTLVQMFKTGHAFTVESKEGVNILIHFGMNTVDLNGQGFEILVEEGSEVTKGQPIVKYDYNFLKANAASIITPVIVLDSEEYKIEFNNIEDTVAGETVLYEIKL